MSGCESCKMRHGCGGCPALHRDGQALFPGRPVPLNTRLALSQGETTVSGLVRLDDCQAGSVDLVVFLLNSLSAIEAILEGSLDSENFSRISSTVFSSEGFARFRFSKVQYRYLRLYYLASGSPGGIAVVATTVNGSRN